MNHSRDRAENETPKEYRQRRAASDAILAEAIQPRAHVFTTLELATMRAKHLKRQLRRGRKWGKVVMSQQIKSHGKPRRHKQRKHQTDDTGQAFTLVGRPRGYGMNDTSELPNCGRRIWLGGISAQRGY